MATMIIREELLEEHSKTKAGKIARYVGKDPLKFEELMNCFFSDEIIVSQRAAWVMNLCVEKHPQLVMPYLERMIKNLDTPVHDAVKRNTVRVLQYIFIPEDLLGIATTHCFNLLLSPDEPIAVKAFSMTVLLNIVKREPDLKNELQMTILDLMENGSPGIKARGRRILAELEKV